MFESIVGFVIAIFVLVFVHELGHFLCAKLTGCRVDEFAVGFRPALMQKKWRGTNYILGLIPVGGYVKLWGENGSEEMHGDPHNPVAFYNRPRWTQAVVLFGGVLFNILFAILCFSFLLNRGMEVSTSDFPNHELKNKGVKVVRLLENFPAKEAGIQVNERIVGWGSSGEDVVRSDDALAEDLLSFIDHQGQQGIVLLVERKDNTIEDTHSRLVYLQSREEGGRNIVGMSIDTMGNISLGIEESLYYGARMALNFSITIVEFLAGFVHDLFAGQSDNSSVSGPIGIAKFAGDSLNQGFDNFVWFLAILSLNLAMFNLLPIPALDGGRLAFLALEALIRRPVSPIWFTWINIGGFVFLIALMLVVTAFDISKFFG